MVYFPLLSHRLPMAMVVHAVTRARAPIMGAAFVGDRSYWFLVNVSATLRLLLARLQAWTACAMPTREDMSTMRQRAASSNCAYAVYAYMLYEVCRAAEGEEGAVLGGRVGTRVGLKWDETSARGYWNAGQ